MSSAREAEVGAWRLGDGSAMCLADPYLQAHRGRLRERLERLIARYGELERAGGLLGSISQGHHYYGLNRGEHEGRRGVWYREWAPAAKALYLTGDFNGWDRYGHPLTRDEFGVWSLFVPDDVTPIEHGSLVKVHVVTEHGPERAQDRIPAYIRRAVQNPTTHDFRGQFWAPPEPYVFKNPIPKPPRSLRIYEAHVGMAPEEGKVGTFHEFTRDVLPRIASLGYNAVQLMAVMEHPYYGSFGYHVSSFFAVSSRFGTPEELKELIDTAHGLGIRVLLDVVHSHAVKNTNEGLNLFDGTTHHYFHAPPRGFHVAWDSMVFDYAKIEVLRFLLSNVRYWLEEFRFDGFRFDGVTSMIYLDHGLGKAFTSYDDYFGGNVDEDAVVYLKLANMLVHSLRPDAATIAEDVSGMPGMARPLSDGGLGFDYRLAMGIPDYWIKLVKERRDEEWNLGDLYRTLLDRRKDEKHVAYAESHDQALVGDQTLAFRLMGDQMYWHMAKGHQSLVIDRGLALHKLIRLVTFALGGEAWLSFMGNEFGHPEWVDFPREGNNWSYAHARRQWSLAERDDLRYKGLREFDRALQELDERHGLLSDPRIEQLAVHEDTKQLVFRRGRLVFVFNFHATASYEGLRIPLPEARDYQAVLSSDEELYEGFGRVKRAETYPWQEQPMYGQKQSLQLYLPNRTALVLAPVTP